MRSRRAALSLGGVLPAAAAVLLSMLALASCLHDWDALDPAGSDGSDACLQYCQTYQSCIAPDDGCAADCDSRVEDCPTQSKLDLIDCVQTLSRDCSGLEAEANFNVCTGLITCWSNSQ